MTVRLRSPHDNALSGLSTTELVRQWQEARTRTFVAGHANGTPVDAEDLFTELVVGQRIATDVTCGRWCVVAQLLQACALDSWAQVATALDITVTDAVDGFHAWITGQADLRHRTGTIGITETDAAELYRLSEVVTW